MTSFALRRERSSLVLRNTRNQSLMIGSLEYFRPTFFNISARNCHFSGELSLDSIFTIVSMTDNVCTLKQRCLELQNIQRHKTAVQW